MSLHRISIAEMGRSIFVSVQQSGPKVPVIVYDLERNCVHDALTAFAQYSICTMLLDVKTVLGRIYQVARFEAYLASKKLDHADLSNTILLQYREHLMEEAPKRSTRGHARPQRATVNAATDAVFGWIWWLQEGGRVEEATIGPYPCSITSEKQPGSGRRGRRAFSFTNPLRLRGSGASARHKPLGFVPDQETRNDVLQKFSEGSSEHACARNALMQRVLEQTGLRRESLLSLRVAQFDRKLLDKCKYDRVAVTPEKQKFGYDDSAKIPLSLAYEVCGFVESERADYVRHRLLRKPAFTPSDHVFLSEQTLEGLKPGSLSRTFSRAMRLSGAPSGSAVHSWRHKFAMDKVDAEFEFRVANNLSLSDADILGAVSIELNHRSPESIRRYLHAAREKARRLRR